MEGRARSCVFSISCWPNMPNRRSPSLRGKHAMRPRRASAYSELSGTSRGNVSVLVRREPALGARRSARGEPGGSAPPRCLHPCWRAGRRPEGTGVAAPEFTAKYPARSARRPRRQSRAALGEFREPAVADKMVCDQLALNESRREPAERGAVSVPRRRRGRRTFMDLEFGESTHEKRRRT